MMGEISVTGSDATQTHHYMAMVTYAGQQGRQDRDRCAGRGQLDKKGFGRRDKISHLGRKF